MFSIRSIFSSFAFLFLLEITKNFKLVGDGWCQSQCYISGPPCHINAYLKKPSHYDECQSACEKESACTGFVIGDRKSIIPNGCALYGNISSDNVKNWTTSGSWIAYPRSSYGFKGYEVDSSSGYSSVQCFKRLNQEYEPNCKVSVFLYYQILHIL